jgi:CRISPR/Cas system-associated exonuclease Cas4 (RecB family)
MNAIEHEERDVSDLPKRQQRFRVQLTARAAEPLAKQWDDENQALAPLATETHFYIDPTEFLDYITVAEFLEHDKARGFISYGTDEDRAELTNRLDAIDRYDVVSVFDEIREAIDQGRSDDAFRAMDAFENPKFHSLAACKAALEAAGVTLV